MKAARLPLFLAGLTLFLVGDGVVRDGGIAPRPAASSVALTNHHLREQPLRFEKNQGQAAKDTRFIARRGGITLSLADDGATLALKKGAEAAQLKLTVANARSVAPVSSTKLPTKANYLVGRDRSKWHTDIPTYGKVTYPSVLDGVDLVYHGERGQLEYDFVVAPGADPASVAMQIDGSDGLTVTETGALRIAVGSGSIVQQRPRVFQRDANGAEHDIQASYRLVAKNHVGFEIAAYDHSKELVIDPEVGFSTFLGGTGSDQVNGLAVDESGNAYVTGTTWSAGPPDGTRIGPRILQQAESSSEDVFVAKLSPTGQMAYFTYVSGTRSDQGRGIAVSGGSAYVTGSTSSFDFPITQGLVTLSGGQDSFVFALNGAGSAFNFSSYIDVGGTEVCGPPVTAAAPEPQGGCVNTCGQACCPGACDQSGEACAPEPPICTREGASDYATSIAVSQGTVYIGGRTESNRFIKVVQATGGIRLKDPTSGAYVASFPVPVGTSDLVVNTRILGGDDLEGGGVTNGVAVDASGVYAVGTAGAGLPNVINENVAGYSRDVAFPDAFVVKLGPDFAPRYGTYLGGTGSEEGLGVALGATGHAYVTGWTDSSRETAGNQRPFPTKNAFQANNASEAQRDAFVVHLNTTAVDADSLVYSTHLGGTGEDVGQSISVDPLGHAYIAGYTQSDNFPNTPLTPRIGRDDEAFLTELEPDGRSLTYSAYLGGNFEDRALAIAVSSNGVYVGGYTSDGTQPQPQGVVSPPRAFPITPGAAQPTYGGGTTDGFVLRIGFSPLTISPGQAVLQTGGQQQFTAEGGVGAGYFFTVGGSAGGTINPQNGLYTAGSRAGTDVVTVFDAAANTASAAVLVTSSSEPPVNELQINPVLSQSPPRGAVSFTATEGKPPYIFDLASNASGATVGPNDGRYTAGSRGNVTDTIRVTDSLGRFKLASVVVGSPIAISPPSPQVASRGLLQLTATGGSGGPYTWTTTAGTISSSGALTAPGSSSVVTVQARDNLGNVGTTNVSVGGAVAIAPADPTTFPNGSIQFTAFGGSGRGFRWVVLTSPSTGGAIDISSGTFTAGATGNVQETIQVADSNNNRAATTINVGPGLSVTASATQVGARDQVSLAAAGGSGAGYTFTIESSQSGASVSAEGVYTAGTAGGIDVIRVTDSAGNVATVTITAAPAPAPPPGTGSSSGGAASSTGGPSTPPAGAPIGNGRITIGSSDGGNGCSIAATGAPSSTTSASLASLVLGLGLLAGRRRRRD